MEAIQAAMAGRRDSPAGRSVRMPVVYVRRVRVLVGYGFMRMRMDVWLVAVPLEIMFMLAMRVVPVCVCMGQWLVRVLMVFGEMEPDARRHQRCSRPECWCRIFSEHQQR